MLIIAMSSIMQSRHVEPSSNDSDVNISTNPNSKLKPKTLGGISFEAESLPEFSEFEDSENGDVKQR